MIRFRATIQKFAKQGEKTGWTYIHIPQELAEKLNPGVKKGFRVKGKVDGCPYSMISLLPMGGGDFIMTLNGPMRKQLGKGKGMEVAVEMSLDDGELQPPQALLDCLDDEPKARAAFFALKPGHRNYFSNWINSAKTEPTRARRIALSIDALLKGWDFGQMLRAQKKDGIN